MEIEQDTRQFREIRRFYATLLAAVDGSGDGRLEHAFASVPREMFLPPGPWKVFIGTGKPKAYVETPSADPIHLYNNVLVALDEETLTNNGQPSLHAAWMAAVAPRPGETVAHIGAGTGYYSAVLSVLVSPGGRVAAFEIDEGRAAAARRHLSAYDAVSVETADATRFALPDADVIYVNAGVAAPPLPWLQALRPGGRLIFPWRPAEQVGMTLLVTRGADGFGVESLAPSWFIPCIGAADDQTLGPAPDHDAVRRSRSIQLTAQRTPDATATAVYRDLWFSTDALPGG